ncbi:MAG TPA: YciI family protein [Rudaea sp.]
MQFLLLVYTDDSLLEPIPQPEYNTMMRGCLERADELQREGRVLDFKQLEPAKTAKSVRIRDGRTRIVDGPFAETKEVLAGFNLIEADDFDEAVRMAEELPWARTGCIEVRPLRDIASVRKSVGLA